MHIYLIQIYKKRINEQHRTNSSASLWFIAYTDQHFRIALLNANSRGTVNLHIVLIDQGFKYAEAMSNFFVTNGHSIWKNLP